LVERECDYEFCATTGGILRPNCPTVQVRDRATDCETESSTAPRTRAVPTLECLEQHGRVLVTKTWAVILEHDADLADRGFGAYHNGSSGRGVLGRVFEQI
jgi:hypothetical protein